MAYDNDAFFTAWKAAFATQAAAQVTMYAAEATALAAFLVADASAACTKSLNERTRLHALATGGRLPDPAIPGCTP